MLSAKVHDVVHLVDWVRSVRKASFLRIPVMPLGCGISCIPQGRYPRLPVQPML